MNKELEATEKLFTLVNRLNELADIIKKDLKPLELVHTIEQALRRNNPMKPRGLCGPRPKTQNGLYREPVLCPTCQKLIFEECAYCPDCGQALDWSDDK